MKNHRFPLRPDDREVPIEHLDSKYEEKARRARRTLIRKVYREIASFLGMYPSEQVARVFKNIIKTQQEWKNQEPDPEIRRLLHDTTIRLYREALKDLTMLHALALRADITASSQEGGNTTPPIRDE